MELLELTPPEFDVAASGIYVVDNDRVAVCAGPFNTVAAALDWIEIHHAKALADKQSKRAERQRADIRH